MCPHHGLKKWLFVLTFFDGLNDANKSSLQSASGGHFLSKTAKDGFNIIENTVANSWTNERGSNLPRGVYEVNNTTLMEAKVEALMKQIEQLKAATQPMVQNPVSAVQVNGSMISCEICGTLWHDGHNCQLVLDLGLGQDPKQVNAINNQVRPQNDPLFSIYNPGWRNHPNFSYRNNQSTPVQQSQFSAPTGYPNQNYKQQSIGQSPNLYTMMTNFMTEQTKATNELKAQSQETSNQLQKLSSWVDVLAAQNRMLEC